MHGQVHSSYLVMTVADTLYENLRLRLVYFVCYSRAMTTDYLGYDHSR